MKMMAYYHQQETKNKTASLNLNCKQKKQNYCNLVENQIRSHCEIINEYLKVTLFSTVFIILPR